MRRAARAIIVKDNQLLVMHRNKFGEEYYTLVGGGIDVGETAEQALVREVREETGITVTGQRLVFTEEAGDPYGTQYIYWCEFEGDEIHLSTESIEAKINQLGKNLYKPVWLPINQLSSVPFVSELLKIAMLDSFKSGFPEQPKEINSNSFNRL